MTADHDLYPEDEHNYRVAVLEAFLAWGIYPKDMPIVSVKTLLWPTMREAAADFDQPGEQSSAFSDDFGFMLSRPAEMLDEINQREDLRSAGRYLSRLKEIGERIAAERRGAMDGKIARKSKRQGLDDVLGRNLLDLGLEADRKVEWLARKLYSQLFWGLLTSPKSDMWRRIIGLNTEPNAPKSVNRSYTTSAPAIEVHSVRMAARRGARDQIEREYVVELTQTRQGFLDPAVQKAVDSGEKSAETASDFKFRRGCTLLIDAETFEIRRVIRTRGDVCDEVELERKRRFFTKRTGEPRNAFAGSGDSAFASNETFAHLHSHVH
ncbi:hypothetical protein P6U16_25810 (plasmid) [Rhizobium sp. 32-5/1]|uniref:hypothetical protein n=1 Tax=Rhizobium sp. 32-5/1 TaxID=3019602 RepID=UPI00240D6DE6|nr:hypothetical protein [Rhizobium sp. 32-5/1]WEZ85487.1 hypothetical protein P6U16_25810 [Rhizobium sp. 32-5/1]